MKKIGDISNDLILGIEHIESPIELTMFNAFMRSGKFVLADKDSDISGEGMFFIPQVKVGKYRADFIVRAIGYRPLQRIWPPNLSATVAVECDGLEFHSTPEQIEYDRERDKYFLENGITTIRLSGSMIHNNANYCLEVIENTIINLMRS